MTNPVKLVFAPCCRANSDGDRGFVEVADEDGRPPEGGKIALDAKVEPWVPEPVEFRSCIHEAAHVIAALLAGQFVDHVTVSPIARTTVIWHAALGNAARAVVYLIGRHAGDKSSRMRVRLMDATWNWYCASSAAGTNGGCDFCVATDLARSEAGDDGALQWLRDREGEALAILDDPTAWRAIRAIADALNERGRLSGREARQIARSAGLEFDAINFDHLEETNLA